MTDTEDGPRASLALLRRITDRHVVDHLLAAGPLTRAEVAALTGISKPTVSESVRRLEGEGLLVEAGRAPTGRRGPAGLRYTFRPDLGTALAVDGGPDGLVAEVLDVRGEVLAHATRSVPSPVAAAVVGPLLVELVEQVGAGIAGPVTSCAVSVAGPVELAGGRLVHLPHSPFLLDELDVRAVLAPHVAAPVEVDNDVNWAALAEQDAGVAVGLADFFYLHLGHGLGGAVVQGGRLVRGADGLAGEPAHLLTTGPDGRARRLVECFDVLGLLRPGSDTIDVPAVTAVLDEARGGDPARADAVLDAVAGALASVVALLNPAAVVVGGPWGGSPGLVGRLAGRTDVLLVPPTALLTAGLGSSAPLHGARLAAVRTLRSRLFDVPGVLPGREA